jgi:hypothetical protein
LSVDVEVDEPIAEPPPEPPAAVEKAPDRGRFEIRVRANEPLARSANFGSHSPRNSQEEIVVGLMQASDRFSDLMVLGRGRLSPAELLDTLFALYTEDVVSFSERKGPEDLAALRS